ncbi:MAG TPA: hypothetical protein VJM32_04945 [Candidatus Saccharimonadales bacterium]|nr:hypothetical protein [Candidatus Saccharimonadales bacterium]
MEPQVVRTGESVPGLIVNVAMQCLDELLAADHVAFVELVRHCRDHNHALAREYLERIRAVARPLLLDTDRVHDLMRHVVISGTEGDGLDMRLVDPRMPNQGDAPPPA